MEQHVVLHRLPQPTLVIGGTDDPLVPVANARMLADRISGPVHAMKGFTIGTGVVGSAHYQIARAWLKQYGLDPDKDVTLVGQADSSALIYWTGTGSL